MIPDSSSSELSAAVFLDRDGTIIEDRGHLSDPSEAVFFPGTVEALSRLQQHFLLFIVTNQSGIGDGLITPDDAEAVNASVVTRLADAGVTVADVYVCPHSRDDRCPCRKPRPYFLRQAAADHQLDLCLSYTVGDHPCDVDLGRNAGATGVFVLTGHGAKHQQELPDDTIVVPGIADAAEWILRQLIPQGQPCRSNPTRSVTDPRTSTRERKQR